MEFKKVLQLRQSCRSFKQQQISDEQLHAVLDAAYLAPVGMGKYEDVCLIVVQKKDVLDKLNSLFAEKIGNPEAVPTYGAPTVIFVCEKEEDEAIMLGANASCLVENMHLAAGDAGLGSCYLFGISQILQNNDEVKALLQIPDGMRTVAGVALGVPAEPLKERTPDSSRIKTISI